MRAVYYGRRPLWFSWTALTLLLVLAILPGRRACSDAASSPETRNPATTGSATTPSPVTPPTSTVPSSTAVTIPVPLPTDQPPPEVPQPSPIPLGRGFLVGGALDGRYRTADRGRTRSLYLNAAELDIDHPFVSQGESIGNIRLQLIGDNAPDIPHGRDLQLSEAYVLYKLPFQTDTASTAYLKVGQFQLPFGLLAVYDPHLLILQPLYAQSLGVRIDRGLAVSGRFYGYLNYDFALTSGSGPNLTIYDPTKVITFRLGRTFVTRNGVVNVGGSLLEGHLPVTTLDSSHPFAVELPASGRLSPDRGGGYIDKSRICGDITLTFKSSMARGEALTGADKNARIIGYYGEYDYRFSARVNALAARSYFTYGQSKSYSLRDSVGLTYGARRDLTLRAVYDVMQDAVPGQGSIGRHRFTVQLLLRF